MSKLQGVADKLYLPLAARIYVSKRFPNYFYDEMAVSLEKDMPYEEIVSKSSEYFEMAGACRFYNTDKMVKVIGVFQYFRVEQVRTFIEELKNHFDEVELLFDAMTMKAINYAANYIKKTGNNDAMLYFGTDSPEEFVSSMDYELIEVRPFFTDARKQLKKELKLYTRIAMKVVDEGGRRGFLVHCRKKGGPRNGKISH